MKTCEKTLNCTYEWIKKRLSYLQVILMPLFSLHIAMIKGNAFSPFYLSLVDVCVRALNGYGTVYCRCCRFCCWMLKNAELNSSWIFVFVCDQLLWFMVPLAHERTFCGLSYFSRSRSHGSVALLLFRQTMQNTSGTLWCITCFHSMRVLVRFP